MGPVPGSLQTGLPLFFLGRGSNVLIADQGLPGITLHLGKGFQKLVREGDTVRVGAGVGLPRLAATMAAGGQGGFEFLAGIPGTVGAAVRLNAGAHGQDLGRVLKRVWVATPENEIRELTVPEIAPGYRTSRLLERPRWLVVEIEVALQEEAAPLEIKQRLVELLRERQARQPAQAAYLRQCLQKSSGRPAGRPAHRRSRVEGPEPGGCPGFIAACQLYH